MKKSILIFASLLVAFSLAGCNTTVEPTHRNESEIVSEENSDVISEEVSEVIQSEQTISEAESDTVTSETESVVSSNDSDIFDWDTLFTNIQSTTEFADSLNSHLGQSSSSSTLTSSATSSATSSIADSSTATSSVNTSSSEIPASDEQLKAMAEQYLNNKYIGTWIADSVINRAYLDETRALTSAYKSGSDEFRFCVITKYYGNNEYRMVDNYVEANSRNNIANMFQSMLSTEKNSVDSGVFLDFGYPDLESSINIYAESNTLLDSHEFVEKWNVDSFYFQVFVSDSDWTDDSLDILVNVAENISHSYGGIKMAVGVHFVEDLTSAKNSLNEQISVGDNYLNKFGKKRDSIVFGVKDGVRDDSCVDEILN